MVNRISDIITNVSNYTSLNTSDSFPAVNSSSLVDDNKSLAIQEYLSTEKAKKMTDSMNQFLEVTTTELRFQYHDELETYYVTLINSKTEEVVREIPSKKLMDMYVAMCEFVGIFIDKKI